MRPIFILIVALLVFTSCSVTTKTQMRLAEHIASPAYLFDSKISDLPKSDSVYMKITNMTFNNDRKVTKVGDLILPFVVFNYRRILMQVELGDIAMNPTYKDFITHSIHTESGRSGNYIASKDSARQGYTLDISIDSCYTKSLYKRVVSVTALALVAASFILSIQSEKPYPAMTFLQMTTTLKKGNTIIARRIYSVRKIQPLFKSDVYRFSLIYGHVDQQRFVLSRNQAEALSSCTKQCIENIVKDINTSLEK